MTRTSFFQPFLWSISGFEVPRTTQRLPRSASRMSARMLWMPTAPPLSR